MATLRSLTRIAQQSILKSNGGIINIVPKVGLGAVRWYSPVRSRAHMPPPPRINRRVGRAQTQEQQYEEQLYEPEVQYSYPDIISQQPPMGGVIQYSDGIADLLSQPVLVMERQIEFMNVFLVCSLRGLPINFY